MIYQLKLVDEYGETVKKGEEGEIWFKSTNCVTSYRNEESEIIAASYSEDGFVKTGFNFTSSSY